MSISEGSSEFYLISRLLARYTRRDYDSIKEEFVASVKTLCHGLRTGDDHALFVFFWDFFFVIKFDGIDCYILYRAVVYAIQRFAHFLTQGILPYELFKVCFLAVKHCSGRADLHKKMIGTDIDFCEDEDCIETEEEDSAEEFDEFVLAAMKEGAKEVAEEKKPRRSVWSNSLEAERLADKYYLRSEVIQKK